MKARPLLRKALALWNSEFRRKTLAFLMPDFDIYARATYFALRTGIGGIGVALPLVLVLGGLILGIHFSDMTALSDFYWLPIPKGPDALFRDWFVGSLIAVGACLIIYGGYGPLENQLLNLAGVASIVVALNPESWQLVYRERFHHVHEVAAVTFFLMIAATIWCCAADTLEGLDEDVRKVWLRRYRLFAIAMVAVPAITLLVATKRWRTIGVEVAGVWIFSAYWFVKTYELKIFEVEPRTGPVPQIQRVGGKLKILRPPPRI